MYAFSKFIPSYMVKTFGEIGATGLLHLSILRTLKAALLNGSFKVWVCRKSHVVLKRRSVSGTGRLIIGAQWAKGFHRPTQFVVKRAGHCIVTGVFRIHEGGSVWVNQGATLVLGSGYINSCVNISVSGSVTIGRNVIISENVTIWDSDAHHIVGRPRGPQPIIIGDHVWIGLNATILKGVTIGDGAVIAAGALVNRNVPPRMLVAGVPARPVRLVEWS